MLRVPLTQTLTRGVGRRILALFLVAGVVPVVFTASLVYFEVGRSTEQRVFDALRQDAKAFGVDIVERLNGLSAQATELTALVESNALASAESRDFLVRGIDAIWIETADGNVTTVLGPAPSAPNTDLVQRLHSDGGDAKIVVDTPGGTGGLLMLRKLRKETASEAALVFRVRPDSVWGPPENQPYNSDICVFTTDGGRLFCTRRDWTGVRAAIPSAAGSEALEWTDGDEDSVSAMWPLFLAGVLRGPTLDIVATQPREHALRSRTDFRRVFVPSLALVLVLVVVASFAMIAQSLVPLERLRQASHELARGNFDARVEVYSQDEFSALGKAFNRMAIRIGRHVGMLEAMSNIDELILGGVAFNDISEAVARELRALTGAKIVAVVTRNADAANQVQVVVCNDGSVRRDTALANTGIIDKLTEPKAIELSDELIGRLPGTTELLVAGCWNAHLVPIVLKDDVTGALLIGLSDGKTLTSENLRDCEALAGRLAVALASHERENALHRRANYDDLTGLPNRQLLKERLRELIETGRRAGRQGALLYLDLDRFKEINDVYGHSVGDGVLVQAAERIVADVRDQDLVARLGGDEFVVVLSDIRRSEVIENTANRLLKRLTQVFTVSDINHYLSASIGIVIFPDDGDSVETLLKNADAAMYRAKEAGRARYAFFNYDLNVESRRKIELERDLRAALPRHELQLHYQPQFSLDTGALCGAEALLRWNHPHYGAVDTSEFIQIAEESELIRDIGRWVVEQTCRDLRQIIDKGLHPGPVSFNVSARQLRDPAFATDVLSSLKGNGLAPANVHVEVTETAIAQNRDMAVSLLDTLRRAGMSIAIDDFGTGYSSLSYLQTMPFDIIKIDRSFVDALGTGSASENLCRTIVKMAGELGKVSVAEGVETREQADMLRDSGCSVVQGYLFSKPLPFREFVAYIRKLDLHTQRRRALEII